MFNLRRLGLILLFTIALLGLSHGGFKHQVSAAGLRLRNSAGYKADTIEFRRIEYVGQCPGVKFSTDSLQGAFTSATTPSKPGRRVIIRNVTSGIDSDPYPYTDRDYSQNDYSEGFSFGINTHHQLRTFSVLEGENEFEYEIIENNRILEQGFFTAEVVIKDLGVYPRQAICSDELKCPKVCDDDNYDDSPCYQITTCSCPN